MLNHLRQSYMTVYLFIYIISISFKRSKCWFFILQLLAVNCNENIFISRQVSSRLVNISILIWWLNCNINFKKGYRTVHSTFVHQNEMQDSWLEPRTCHCPVESCWRSAISIPSLSLSRFDHHFADNLAQACHGDSANNLSEEEEGASAASNHSEPCAEWPGQLGPWEGEERCHGQGQPRREDQEEEEVPGWCHLCCVAVHPAVADFW